MSEERDGELRAALLCELVEEASELPPGDEFDGEESETPDAQRHAALVGWLGAASWDHLRAAVAAVLADHRPRMSVSINTLSCPDHHVLENPEGNLAAMRAARPGGENPRVFVDCPSCVVTPIVVCSGRHCCDGWPCDTTDNILGALGLSLADLDELRSE